MKITLRWAHKDEQQPGLEGPTCWLNHWHYRRPAEQRDPLWVREWRLGVVVEAEED